ncbi:hypothetical protein NPX13_g11408 [Xylaria arbuscula]|uniref:Uncharacterized protein n=1 Tax=Xylaria arbuscula TaxID=114810 RepID=A0A9W8N2X5_9PEZI|nr:hypothetical protein NPX13_g11408 [Xylaria arbuscula]
MSSRSAEEVGPHFLGCGLTSRAASSHVVRNSHEKDGCLAREQEERYAHLRREVRRLQQQNISLENELREQRTNYSLLAGDMIHICEELRRLLDERDRERAQEANTSRGSQCHESQQGG